MAARLNKLHQEDIRQKIKASQLLNVLQNHALTGQGDFPSSRIKAIEILLKKSVSDLTSMELMGEGGGPLTVEILRFGASPTPK